MASTSDAKLGSRTIAVRELTLQEIYDLTHDTDKEEAEILCDLLRLTSGLERDDVMCHTPSELQPLVDAMVEVNKSFFDQAAAINMTSAATMLERMIKAVFTLAFLNLSNDSARKPGDSSSQSS